jgi:choline dehydrogenase-like flavoprotein
MWAEPIEGETVEADVCIVGAGPAGLTLANELVEAGRQVVLLETGDLVYDPSVQLLAEGPASGPLIKDYPSYLRDSRHFQFGGAGAWWGGYCVPFAEIDFRERSWVPDSGWPIGARDLSSYYDRATRWLNLAPFNQETEDRRTRKRLVFEGSCGLSSHYYHVPATYSRFTTDAQRSLGRAPNVRVCLRSMARRLLGSGGRLEAIEVVGLPNRIFRVEADQFVLAGGGLENARMLLEAEEEPGLAGQINGRIAGRYFMEHPHAVVGTLDLDASADWSVYDRLRTDPALGHRTFAVLSLNEELQARHRLLNASLQIRRGSSHAGSATTRRQLFVRAEQAPNADSRLSLTPDRDRWGRRRAQLRWEVLPLDWDSIVRSAQLMGQELAALGAAVDISASLAEPWPGEPRGPYGSVLHTWGCHHMGTTRMHRNPELGVVNPDCRVHGLSNLFVAGSSVFPTSSFANPTITLVALTLRLADHLKDLLGLGPRPGEPPVGHHDHAPAAQSAPDAR